MFRAQFFNEKFCVLNDFFWKSKSDDGHAILYAAGRMLHCGSELLCASFFVKDRLYENKGLFFFK